MKKVTDWLTYLKKTLELFDFTYESFSIHILDRVWCPLNNLFRSSEKILNFAKIG